MYNHPSLVSMPFQFDIDPCINSLSKQSQTNVHTQMYYIWLYLKSKCLLQQNYCNNKLLHLCNSCAECASYDYGKSPGII